MKPLQYILFFLLIQGVISCSPGKKVVSSDQDIPRWVSGIGNGYIVGEGEGTTFGSAKDKALEDVSLKITRTIAQKASTSLKITSTNNNTNNHVVSTEDFRREDVVKTFAPILNGISMLKVEDYYWLKRRTKEGEKVKYYIKYPISEKELDREISKWKDKYNKIVSEIEQILNKPEDYSKVEEIMYDLQVLDGYINFGDEFMVNRINNKKIRLLSLLNRIEISIIKNKMGRVSFCYTLDGNKIAYSSGPEIKTNNISNYSIKTSNSIWTLTYNPKMEKYNKDHSVLLESKINGRKISKYIPLKVKDLSVSIEISEPVTVNKVEHWFANAETFFTINIRSNNDNECYINAIHLTPTGIYSGYQQEGYYSNKVATINITYDNYPVTGMGSYTLEGDCDCALPGWETIFSEGSGYLKVVVELTSKYDQKKHKIKFNNVKINSY